jgi:hypothetical protein
MNIQNNKKLSIKTLLSIVGVAGASVVMSFPAFAQISPNSSDSPSSNQQMTGERKPTDDRSMQNQAPAGNQQMNSNTPASTQPMNSDRLPTDDRSMQGQTQGSQQMNTGTSNTSDRQTTTGTTTVETQQYNRSTTSQQVNPDGATPTTTPSATPSSPTDTPAVTPTDTPTTTPQNTTSPAPATNQQAPDQGVRALW